MSAPPDDESVSDPETSPSGARSRVPGPWFVALPAVTFIVGAVLGGVVIGVGGSGGTFGVGGDDSSDGSASSGPSSTGPSTAVVVPDSCLESAQTVTQATGLIEQGVGDVRDFQPDALIDLLNQLQTLDDQARQQAATCTGTTVTDAGSPSTSPTDTAAPTSSPTDTPTASASSSPAGPTDSPS